MKPRSLFSEGIVLKRKNYGEADRILTIYSKRFGKVKLLAKGVRKPKSRKKAALEVFTLLKFSGVKGKRWDIITEASVLESFSKIRKDLKKVLVAFFLVETVDKLTTYEETNVELYNLLLQTLKKLTKTKKLRGLREKFVQDALVILGFWPLGKEIADVDSFLKKITEKEVYSVRVGKKIFKTKNVIE